MQPADANSFYRDRGKGAAWGNGTGWTLEDAVAAGHPEAGVLVGESGVPGQYSWVLIMYGTNDIDATGWDPAAWQEGYRTFVQGYEALGVVPVVSTIPPKAAHATDGRVEAANAAILALAVQERIPWVDYHGLILHYQPVDWVGTLIDVDGTHPTAGTGGTGFTQTALTSTDGYALRTKLAFDVAEKLRDIVWNDGPADPVTAAPGPERARRPRWSRSRIPRTARSRSAWTPVPPRRPRSRCTTPPGASSARWESRTAAAGVARTSWDLRTQGGAPVPAGSTSRACAPAPPRRSRCAWSCVDEGGPAAPAPAAATSRRCCSSRPFP